MTIHYSPTERGFFNSRLHKELPADALKITRARHAELIEAQADGAQIVPDPDTGKPMALWPDADQLRRNLVAATKAEAARRIEAIMPLYSQLNALRAGAMDDVAHDAFARIDAIRAGSNSIEQAIIAAPADALDAFPITANSLWPEPEGN